MGETKDRPTQRFFSKTFQSPVSVAVTVEKLGYSGILQLGNFSQNIWQYLSACVQRENMLKNTDQGKLNYSV